MKESFLSGLIQKKVLPSQNSECIQVFEVVPQGTILVLLLFNINVKSLWKRVQCADDIFVFYPASDISMLIENTL